MNSSNLPRNHSLDNEEPYCGRIPSAYDVGFIVFFCLIILIGLCGNILVCLGVRVCRSLRTATNVYVVSLALSDIGVCLTIMPFRILEYSRTCANRAMCIAFMTSDVAVSTVSVLTLLAISIDRFLAITMPFTYRDIVTMRRAALVASFIWLYSIVWAAAAPFSWETNLLSIDAVLGTCVNTNLAYTMTINVIHFYLPLLVISCIYFRLWLIAGREQDEIEALTLNNSRAMIRRSTITVAIVYLAFVMCWFPNAILVTMVAIKPDLFDNLWVQNPKLVTAVNAIFVSILPPLNSSLNPFIYGLYNSSFRKAFAEVIRRRWKASLVINNPIQNGTKRLPKISATFTKKSSVQLRIGNGIGTDI